MVICDKYNPEELVKLLKVENTLQKRSLGHCLIVFGKFLLTSRMYCVTDKSILVPWGNHECRTITQTYGFYDECLSKYGHSGIWNFCCEVFDSIPLAAVIDDRVLCVHGGLSPKIHTISEIHSINRVREIPLTGPFADLLWSDPEEEIGSFQLNSSRGAGVLFGRTAVETFLEENQLQLICRSHQLCLEGYKYLWDQKLLTIWSAPNYTYSCKNKAAVVRFIPDGTCAFSVLKQPTIRMSKQKHFTQFKLARACCKNHLSYCLHYHMQGCHYCFVIF
ncbi:Serine/threonine-protein phosphatase 4 catalytic subunit [Trichinella spiralis]|uniref:protein-serine/threonine phosphatase n=1 Tax=Trichinella spiralis TaxID=6334 RepID=A0ABR3KZY6_TRISP